MSSMKMVMQIYGARRGEFTDDDKRKVQYCSVYGSNDLDGGSGGEAVGMSCEKFSADPAVFDAVKGAKLPQWFQCDIEARGGATGMKLKIKTAKPVQVAQ